MSIHLCMDTDTKQHLGPGDWIAAAFRILREAGIDSVRIEPLAKRLDVTRGSFYWHFKDRAALLSALLDEWERSDTNRVIEIVEAEKGTARERLSRLLAFCVTDDGKTETELRIWGIRDKNIGTRIAAVDAIRKRYLAELYEQCGFTAAEAAHRAQHIYNWWVGHFLLANGMPLDERLALAAHMHRMSFMPP
jgi:AcrR family transcriptional regulator